MLHDMAPVAGRISYAEKDWLAFLLGPLKGLLPPRIPFDRIVGVLEEIGTSFVNQVVGVQDSAFLFIFIRPIQYFLITATTTPRIST